MRVDAGDGAFRRGASVRPGFSLFELVAVLVVLGVLAGSAIPVGRRISDFHARAVRSEVRAYLEFARGMAAATGVPTGVRIDVASQAMSWVQIERPGEAPSLMVDGTGAVRPPVRVDRHGGAGVDGVTGFGPASGAGGGMVIWFGHAGVPEHRNADGSYVGEAPGEIVISFTSGDSLRVQPHTGVIE